MMPTSNPKSPVLSKKAHVPARKTTQDKKASRPEPEQAPQQLMNAPAPLQTQPADQVMVDSSDDGEDERMRAEKDILNTHLEAVREEAQLIQREGEMITTLELAFMNEEEYDMREYLSDARQIAMRKFQMYGQLMQLIDNFEGQFIENKQQ